jgi:hypothetical protein
VSDPTADTFVQAIMSFATFNPRKGTPRTAVTSLLRTAAVAIISTVAVPVLTGLGSAELWT